MSYYFGCPRCGSNRSFATVAEDDSSLGCLLFLIGGLLALLIYADSTRGRVQCTHCGHIFRQPPLPRSPLSKFALAVIGLIVASVIVTVVMTSIPALVGWLPDLPFITKLEDFVEENPKALVASLFPALIIVTVLAFVVSFVSNRRYRQDLRKTFETAPKAFSEARNESNQD